MKKFLSLLPVAALALALSGCGSLHDEDTIWNAQRPEEEIADFSDIVLNSGTFIGIGTGGFYGEVHVMVIIDEDGRMIDVSVYYDNETPNFAAMVYDVLPDAVLAAQSANVPVVTGATFTSRAFLGGVLDAMMQASDGALPEGFAPEEPEYESALEALDLSATNNGMFLGSGQGFGGQIDLAFVIENNSITDIIVVEHFETLSFAERAFNELFPMIINESSVDTVTGSTETAKAIIEAVNVALDNSRANNQFELPEPEPEIEEEDYEEEIEIEEEPEEETTVTPEPETTTTPPVVEEPTAPATRFTAGTFTGSATGFKSTVTVSVTVSADAITSITVTDQDETEDFWDMAVAVIPQIIAANDTNVSTVSHATLSSSAIINAVAAAIAQATN